MTTKLSPIDRIVHEQFSRYGQNAKEWLAKCALLLPEIERRRIWKKRRFSSLFEYAAKLAGMNRHSVEDALRILHKIEDKPALKRVVEERGLNAVRPVVAISTAETAEFWAQKAREMSKNTLETYVREFRKNNDANGHEADSQSGGMSNRLSFRTSTPTQPEKLLTNTLNNLTERIEDKRIIAMDLEPEIAAQLNKLKGSGNWNDLMKELLELRRQKIEKEKPEAVETPSRHIPTKIKTYVLHKTRGQCAYPGCSKSYKILHHTQRWALENIHDPNRLVPLCTTHERIAHHGLIKNEQQPAEQWSILKQPVWWERKQLVDREVLAYRKIPSS